MDINQQNNDKRFKANEHQDFCFCGGSKKSRFKWLNKEPLKIFLNFSYEKKLTVSFISF